MLLLLLLSFLFFLMTVKILKVITVGKKCLTIKELCVLNHFHILYAFSVISTVRLVTLLLCLAKGVTATDP